MSDRISIMPLGGIRENGKNMYAVLIGESIFILDSGLKYPESKLLGVDIVIPDIQYLKDNSDKIVGIFLTHGHVEAIGALPYLLNSINVPIYGSELTISLVKSLINLKNKNIDFDDYHVINENSKISFSENIVSFFKTNHTIPNSLGIVIDTKKGSIVYTGDFKMDLEASNNYKMNLSKIASIGKKKIIALLGDSENINYSDNYSSEIEIKEHIDNIFRNCNGRIIVAAVSSNIQRIQQIIDSSFLNNKKIVTIGNDPIKFIRNSLKLKKIKLPIAENKIFVSYKNMDNLTDNQTVILVTGKIGEPIKNLNRIAVGADKNIKLKENDLIFLATTPQISLEGYVAKTRDLLFRSGATVRQLDKEISIINHASKKDFELLVSILTPKNIIPINGEYTALKATKEMALKLGYKEKNILLLNNGDHITYDDNEFILESSNKNKSIMIDGSDIGDVGSVVINDRRILSEDGAFIVVVTIDRKKKKVVSRPKIDSKGFVYIKSSKELLNLTANLVEKTVQDGIQDNKEFNWGNLKNSVREAVSKFLFEQTKRRPVILPVIMEVNQNGRRHKKNIKKINNN